MIEIFSSIFSPLIDYNRVFSFFPGLLDYSFLAPTILRIFVAFIILSFGWINFNKQTNWSIVTAIVEWLGAASLLVGFMVQFFALILNLIVIGKIFKGMSSIDRPNYFFGYHLIILAILVSLMLTGAGALAIDLPL